MLLTPCRSFLRLSLLTLAPLVILISQQTIRSRRQPGPRRYWQAATDGQPPQARLDPLYTRGREENAHA
jgi:hypothetical protein